MKRSSEKSIQFNKEESKARKEWLKKKREVEEEDYEQWMQYQLFEEDND